MTRRTSGAGTCRSAQLADRMSQRDGGSRLIHDGLSGRTRKQFESMRVGDLMDNPAALLDQPFVRQLSREKNVELASATMLTAHKPTA